MSCATRGSVNREGERRRWGWGRGAQRSPPALRRPGASWAVVSGRCWPSASAPILGADQQTMPTDLDGRSHAALPSHSRPTPPFRCPGPEDILPRMNPTLLLLAVATVDLGPLAPLRWAPSRSRVNGPADLLVLLRRASAGLRCPHCAGSHLQRWGRLGMRQRYRCVACGRTFNELSDTALHRLKRKDLWAAFCRCMVEGLTVRRAAQRLGIHRDTAFRWRHKLLRELLSGETYPLGPTVNIGESRVHGRSWLLLGLDDRGRAVGGAVGPRRADTTALWSLLGSRLERAVTLLTLEGRYAATARFAQLAGRWSQRRPVERAYDQRIEPIPRYAFRFRLWLKRFRGVADHYLDHYLAWFRLADRALWNGVCRPTHLAVPDPGSPSRTPRPYFDVEGRPVQPGSERRENG